MQPDTVSQFTGLKIVQPLPIDMKFGAETSVLDVERNSSGDWRPDEPTPKCQLMKTSAGVSIGDTECCTNFSATNDLAVQMDWLIAQGHFDPNGLNFLKNNGYIDANGHVNLSPRFSAVKSGTTSQAGNSLPTVWASLATDGAVPESVWPMPSFDGLTTAEQGWAEYFNPAIPEAITALGKQFLQWFNVQWEWFAWEGAEKTMTQLAAGLQVSPLQIATAVCAGWNTDNPIGACGDGTAHATTMMNVEPGAAYDILDHYAPYMKRFAPAYSISYAMRGVISSIPQNAVAPAPFTYDYEVSLALGAPAGTNVKALQQGLQTVLDKTGAPYMQPGVFGIYGPITEQALGRFQVDHGIADAPQGHDFGPQSRKALTQALADAAFAASGSPLPRPLNWGSHRPN